MMDAYRGYNTNARPPPPPPPPPPPMTELYQYQRPPAPLQAQWYPSQNHYQPTPQPPPPPGMQNPYPPQHWGAHPAENHAPQGYPPPPPVYTNQHYPPHQFPPSNRPQMLPLPYHISLVPTQPYYAGHQEWGNPNWNHRQAYEYPGENNKDDWATRARAWATAKTAMDNQQQQSPFPQGIRTDLQTDLHDQYAHVANPQHLEMKPGSYPVAQPHNPYGTENYKKVSLEDGQSNTIPGAPQHGSVTFSSALATLGPDYHLPKNGSLADKSKTTVHPQEVPSSYSSIAGGEVGTNKNQMQFKSFPGPSNALQGGQQAHPMMPAVDRPDLSSRFFSYHNQIGDLSDKPLDFAPRANTSSMYPHPDSSGPHRGADSSATMAITHSWVPHLAPGSIYSSAAISGLQFDPFLSAHSSVHRQVASFFGTVSGPNFQPTLPSINGPFGPGGGTSLVSPTNFPVDAYGASSADRPKKASVPNWLKEEIIKKKAVMATTPHEYRKEETQSMHDEIGHQSFGKGDQADSKSMDSSRSAKEEDDEDYVEAARTIAINKEIKRVLTEVLMKVTDDLFDEIAMKVLNEEVLITEVAPNQSHAKVLVPDKFKETDTEKDTGKQNSDLPGDLLGLASYDTDSDDEKDEINTKEQLSNEKQEMVKNGHPHKEKVDGDTKITEKLDVASSMGVTNSNSIGGRKVHEVVSGTKENDRKQQNGLSSLDLKNNVRDKERSYQDCTAEISSLELRITSGTRDFESKMCPRSSPVTEAVIDRVRENKKEDPSEEKHLSKGKLDNRNGSKDKKELSRIYEKQNDPVFRKRSSRYDEEAKKQTERGRSPSSVRSSKRQVLRSPKHSRHRHSPYYSFEGSRKRGSRSPRRHR